MKKLLFIPLILWAGVTFAADVNFLSYTEEAAPTVDDMLYGANDPTGVPADRKIELDSIWSLYLSTAGNISGVWEIQDNILLNFGNDADCGVKFNTTSGKLEFICSSATDFTFLFSNPGAGDVVLATDNPDGSTLIAFGNTAGFTGSGEAEGDMNYDKTSNQLEVSDGTDFWGVPVKQHSVITFDPSLVYDQESTYRSLPLFKLDSAEPEGITLIEWKLDYVGGDPTTELDADLICDTTPDYNTAAGATVMDVLDTTAGTSTATTFDSASCATGANVYIHFGADPTDANVLVTFDVWYYVDGE